MKQFEDLVKNIEELENTGWSSEFDISKYLLSEDEIVKKLIVVKNPSIPKDQVDMIVDSEDVSISKIDENLKKERKNTLLPKNATEEQKINQQKRLEEEKKRKLEEIKKNKAYYKDKLSEYYKKAKELITEIKNAFFQITKETKDLIKKGITSVVQIGSAIPGITVMIGAPPYNIPAAISYTMTIVEIFIDLIAKIKSVIPFLAPLKKLSAVMNDKSLTIVSTVLNSIVKTLLKLFKIFSAYDAVIKLLLDSLIKLIRGSKSKIFRRATRKLKKLGHLKKSTGKKGSKYEVDDEQGNKITIFSYDEDDIDEVKELLDTFLLSDQENRVIDYKQKIDETQLGSISSQFDDADIAPTVADIFEENTEYVYDVKLPDGNILYGIGESQLEDLKQTYILIIQQVQDLNSITMS